MSKIAKMIAQKTGYENVLDEWIEKLSGSELNTLLLKLFRNRIKRISAPELLQNFEKNRFAVPSTINPHIIPVDTSGNMLDCWIR